MILVGDLDQLPPVKYIPMYFGTFHGNALWCSFDMIITLSTIFCQGGDNPSQVALHQLLTNFTNAKPTLKDWNLLMSRTNSSLSHSEQFSFEDVVHLYATNDFVMLHNKQMLKKLNQPIARCYVEERKKQTTSKLEENEHLDKKCFYARTRKSN